MKVSVRIITYNQKHTISQAIQGVLNQKTHFPIEICIGDDGSDDGTSEICHKYSTQYPDIKHFVWDRTNPDRLRHNNLWGYNWVETLKRCTGEYIALLDGDDYWIDPEKLRKQHDFLEHQLEFGMVHTRFKWFNEFENKYTESKIQIPEGDIYDAYLQQSFIGNLTTFTRKELINQFLERFKEEIYNWKTKDRALWLYVSSVSKVGYLKDITAVYRCGRNTKNDYHSHLSERDLFLNSYIIRHFFIEKIQRPKSEVVSRVNENYFKDLLEYESNLLNFKSALLAFKELKAIKRTNVTDYLLLIGSINCSLKKISRTMNRFVTFLYRKYLKFQKTGKRVCMKYCTPK